MNQHTRPAYRILAVAALFWAGLGLAGCSANETGSTNGGAGIAAAPSTSTDPGSRYLEAEEALGAVTVETPPVDRSWTGGPTSIARPASGSQPTTRFTQPTGSPDSRPFGSPDSRPSSSSDLPPPTSRRTPPPPPPPTLR